MKKSEQCKLFHKNRSFELNCISLLILLSYLSEGRKMRLWTADYGRILDDGGHTYSGHSSDSNCPVSLARCCIIKRDLPKLFQGVSPNAEQTNRYTAQLALMFVE